MPTTASFSRMKTQSLRAVGPSGGWPHRNRRCMPTHRTHLPRTRCIPVALSAHSIKTEQGSVPLHRISDGMKAGVEPTVSRDRQCRPHAEWCSRPYASCSSTDSEPSPGLRGIGDRASVDGASHRAAGDGLGLVNSIGFLKSVGFVQTAIRPRNRLATAWPIRRTHFFRKVACFPTQTPAGGCPAVRRRAPSNAHFATLPSALERPHAERHTHTDC